MSMLTSYIPSWHSHRLAVHVSCAPTLMPLWLPAVAVVESHFPSSPLLAVPETARNIHAPFSGKGPMGTQVAGNSNNQMAGIKDPESPHAHRAILSFSKSFMSPACQASPRDTHRWEDRWACGHKTQPGAVRKQ